ncbi:MAG: LysR substrate-binding domain-containing protein, partial [Methylophaga sp.]
VASGLGITLIPQMAINSDMVRHAEIELRPLQGEQQARRDIGLVWRPSFRRTSALEQLSASFSQALAQNPV